MTGRASQAAAAGAALLLLALGSAAAAEGAAAPATEEAKLAARLLAEEGDRLYDVADFSASAEKYKASYLLFPDPELLFSMGECFWNLRDPDRATFFYRRYLAKMPGAVNRALVEARLAEIERLASAGLGPPPLPAVSPASGPPAAASPAPSPIAPSSAPVKTPLVTRPEESAIGFSSESPPPPSPGSGSLFNKWWFWTGLGAVVLGVGVTAIVLANQR
jgi:hypothetical protein